MYFNDLMEQLMMFYFENKFVDDVKTGWPKLHHQFEALQEMLHFSGSTHRFELIILLCESANVSVSINAFF
ncbi:unnamed protein product [Adineta ricciae]|uniref:Uncharacterized protein n=1 Tax=Adineta ricciae TaxID=249248 RepID=A0A815QSM4_ADIRI|nr:unnamed protein product [Adineta ricciae]